MDVKQKVGIAFLVLLAAAAGLLAWRIAWVKKTNRLGAQAKLLFLAAVESKDASRAQAALSAYEVLVEHQPRDWWPNYANLFGAARLAQNFASADAAFARMTAHREAKKAKDGSFQDVAWHRAAANYGFSRFEAMMVPRDKAVNEGDERTIVAATHAALESYDLALKIRGWRQEDLAGAAEPADLLQGIAKDEANLNSVAVVIKHMREHDSLWTVNPEMGRAHALYLQGVNRYRRADADHSAAEALLKKALEIDPKHPFARGLLCFIAFDAKREAEAAALARESIAIYAALPERDEKDLRALADIRGVLAETLLNEARAKAKSKRRLDRAAAAELLAEARAEIEQGLKEAPECRPCLRLKVEIALQSAPPIKKRR